MDVDGQKDATDKLEKERDNSGHGEFRRKGREEKAMAREKHEEQNPLFHVYFWKHKKN